MSLQSNLSEVNKQLEDDNSLEEKQPIQVNYNVLTLHSVIYKTSIVPALRAGIIYNDKQWELYHLYL